MLVNLIPHDERVIINRDATSPAISSNGQFVAFDCVSSFYVSSGAPRASRDVYVRDLLAGTTTLVSAGMTGTNGGNGFSTSPLISAAGVRIVFESAATNLVADDTNGVTDILVRDRIAGTTTLVSADAFEAGDGAGPSELGSISLDGRYVAFVKRAANRLNGTWSMGEVYVRDLPSGTTAWASKGVARYLATNFFAGTNICFNAAISADGASVVFQAAEARANFGSARIIGHSVLVFRYRPQTAITELVSSNGSMTSSPTVSADGRFTAYGGTNALYVFDSLAGTNRIIGSVGTAPFNDCRASAMTPDGRRVAFIASVSSCFGVYVHDWPSGNTFAASVNTNGIVSGPVVVTTPAISPDGRLVAFESIASDLVANDFNQASDIFVRDLNAGTTALASEHAASRPAATASRLMTLSAGAVSADGRTIAFASLDNELTGGDANRWQDVFVRDSVAGTTANISLNKGGTGSGNALSTTPVLAADGRTVLFQSFASDLVPGDYNDTRDILVLRLAGPDTDGDGLEDDWEMTYFNTLARDGSDDSMGTGRPTPRSSAPAPTRQTMLRCCACSH